MSSDPSDFQTIKLLIKEIETILGDYPEFPYQVAFSHHDLQRELILHILGRIPDYHQIASRELEARESSQDISLVLGQKIQLENLIRGCILHVLRENADRVSRYLGQRENASDRASLEAG